MERKIRVATCRLSGINFLSRSGVRSSVRNRFKEIFSIASNLFRRLLDEPEQKNETGRSRENGRESWRGGKWKGREGGTRGASNHRASCQIVVDLFPFKPLTPRKPFEAGSFTGSQVPREKSMPEGLSRQIITRETIPLLSFVRKKANSIA